MDRAACSIGVNRHLSHNGSLQDACLCRPSRHLGVVCGRDGYWMPAGAQGRSFAGSGSFARFSDFVYDPLKAIMYLRDLLYGRSRRYLGHSPAGGAMVIALLVCLAATVATGMIAYGEQGKGPLAALASEDDTHGSEAGHRAPAERRREQRESIIGELHGLLANSSLVLFGKI